MRIVYKEVTGREIEESCAAYADSVACGFSNKEVPEDRLEAAKALAKEVFLEVEAMPDDKVKSLLTKRLSNN